MSIARLAIMKIHIYVALTLCTFLQGKIVRGQLVVNVRNKGGDILRESIHANTSQDTVTLEFQKSDGTLITQFIDFKNEIQVFKALVLGEEERGQNQFQDLCFITRFIKNEFISSDAMSKLRQKNPGAIRHPEDDKGQETHQKDLLVDVDKAHLLSPHIVSMCQDARDSSFTRDTDLRGLSRSMNKDYGMLLSVTKRRSTYQVARCKEVAEVWRPCTCQYEICIGWYPCGLKYCRGRDSTGKVVSYRCGIKTCRKCRVFQYYVKQKHQCLWDEAV